MIFKQTSLLNTSYAYILAENICLMEIAKLYSYEPEIYSELINQSDDAQKLIDVHDDIILGPNHLCQSLKSIIDSKAKNIIILMPDITALYDYDEDYG